MEGLQDLKNPYKAKRALIYWDALKGKLHYLHLIQTTTENSRLN